MDDNSNTIDNVTFLYYDEIYQYCRYRISNDDISEDITQEVFMALYLNWNNIDKSRIRKWLYSTAHNKITDYYKKNAKEKEQLIYFENFEDSIDISSFDVYQHTEKELLEYHKKIINSLTYFVMSWREFKLYNISVSYKFYIKNAEKIKYKGWDDGGPPFSRYGNIFPQGKPGIPLISHCGDSFSPGEAIRYFFAGYFD